MSKNAALEAAKSYVAQGWAVLPVHAVVDDVCACRKGRACSSPGKHPKTQHGVHGASTDVAKVRRWFGADKLPVNIGIVTGQASGLIVLDVDPRNGGRETLDRLVEELGPLPDGPVVETGGDGEHRYFLRPDVKLKGKAGPGVDVKSDGGYVVAPPSTHRSGDVYLWRNGCGFDVPLPELPDAWLKALTAKPPPKSSECPTEPTDPSGTVRNRQEPAMLLSGREAFLEDLEQKLQSNNFGQRNDLTFELARRLKFHPTTKDLTLDELRPIVRQFHKAWLPFIRNTRDFQDQWEHFVVAYGYAKIPHGGFMQAILEAAKAAPVSEAVERYPDSEDWQLTVAICRELQRFRGDKPFFLSGEMLADLFDGLDPRVARRRLSGLCRDGFLVLVESGKPMKKAAGGGKGTPRRANVYRYVKEMDE